MKTPGLVTIMVPVLNGEIFLPLALDSLLAQDYTQFEIVILDNQSTDRTAEICHEYERRDGRVRYVPDTINRISHDAADALQAATIPIAAFVRPVNIAALLELDFFGDQ